MVDFINEKVSVAVRMEVFNRIKRIVIGKPYMIKRKIDSRIASSATLFLYVL